MQEPTCSFCGKTQRAVRKLIGGNAAYICDECVYLCVEILGDEQDLRSFLQDDTNEPSDAGIRRKTISTFIRVTGTHHPKDEQ